MIFQATKSLAVQCGVKETRCRISIFCRYRRLSYPGLSAHLTMPCRGLLCRHEIVVYSHVFALGEAKSMHQPGKWWVGLLPIAALWVLANGVRTESVEADLASRAQAVLTEAPEIASEMKATALGRDVRLEGLEFADGDGTRMGQAVDRANGVRLVDWRLQRVLPARPFEFAATRVGDELRLTGSVPTPAIRDRVRTMAKDNAAGKSVLDGLAYATR